MPGFWKLFVNSLLHFSLSPFWSCWECSKILCWGIGSMLLMIIHMLGITSRRRRKRECSYLHCLNIVRLCCCFIFPFLRFLLSSSSLLADDAWWTTDRRIRTGVCPRSTASNILAKNIAFNQPPQNQKINPSFAEKLSTTASLRLVFISPPTTNTFAPVQK